jgi:dipeptidyl aminopeptidase/acylaminoacyl peptidase
MVAARHYLVHEGIARADQFLLTGWSYGGYLTLQALGTYPELWVGGLAGTAIAGWTLFYEDAVETVRSYIAGEIGGTPQDNPEQYARSSPSSYVEQVQAPLLILQGRNDTRCPPRQLEAYEARLRALGKPVEVHWFEAGHIGAFADNELAIQHMEQMLQFAYRILRSPRADGAATHGETARRP